MAYDRPAVLSIAGLDPSGGAGLLADIKTFEQHRCLGFGVATAITAQTEDRFFGIEWLSPALIWMQCQPLLDRYPVAVVKIGITESLPVLLDLVDRLQGIRDKVQIIWDPVIRASAGFRFMDPADKTMLVRILQGLSLLTPNTQEASLLSGLEDTGEAALWLAQYCPVLLKGGHAAERGVDYLFEKGQRTAIDPGQEVLPPKHGSGCVLSSAIAAGLARGHTLPEACRMAKTYTETILNSNDQLLAYHDA
ncbi:hydroxymethylpyrimidine/phosphomethylpyrimidine kinase [Taibaiella chishuiensis]|uniref:hydroxymethylpyrimidine kinase n=1 Tax=Taibaiella chishuiensis TaxID=1434707 RepID=A0A2P8CSP2_9BACT|nr:hydroxymethylpyrimidine/phosphomethylpyrimidine kinase [Taibaiella chishuiensis]PSK87993.1 hydroxymethylpyrimidine/phosphomethylpyrimidine kinase [Taibaiella chishuiensis]